MSYYAAGPLAVTTLPVLAAAVAAPLHADSKLRWGLLLFAILFLWQLPHFMAIAIFRQNEYERAGLKVMPSVQGVFATKVAAVVYTALLVVVSVLLVPLGVAGYVYLFTALVLGAVFLGTAIQGLRAEAGDRWAKKLFFVSLVYLTVLFAVLMIDAT